MPRKWDTANWRVLSFLHFWARWPHTYWSPCLPSSLCEPHFALCILCSLDSPLSKWLGGLCWLSWCYPPWHPTWPQIPATSLPSTVAFTMPCLLRKYLLCIWERSLTGGLNHSPPGRQEWESDSKRENQPGVFFLLPCFLPHPIQRAWKGCQWFQAQRKENIFHVSHEIQLHWSLVQQEEGLALIKTKVGNKTETFISCSWQEQFPVLSILSEDSPPSKHIDWSRKQLDLTLLAFKTHFVRCAEAETSVHQLHHSAAAQQGK